MSDTEMMAIDDKQRKALKKQRKEEKRRKREMIEATSQVVMKACGYTQDEIDASAAANRSSKINAETATKSDTATKSVASGAGATVTKPSTAVQQVTKKPGAAPLLSGPDAVLSLTNVTGVFDAQYLMVCSQLAALEKFRATLAALPLSATAREAGAKVLKQGKKRGASGDASSPDEKKKRTASAYNIFVSKLTKTGLNMKEASVEWKKLSEEERQRYKEEAISAAVLPVLPPTECSTGAFPFEEQE